MVKGFSDNVVKIDAQIKESKKEKKSNSIKVILYISIWVIIWGTLGSLIDYPLYKNKIYLEGSIYQYLTFTITAIISIISAKFFYKKVEL